MNAEHREAAETAVDRFHASHLVALVRAGATFVDGVEVEREEHRSAA